jgi:HlyD family secretion protein
MPFIRSVVAVLDKLREKMLLVWGKLASTAFVGGVLRRLERLASGVVFRLIDWIKGPPGPELAVPSPATSGPLPDYPGAGPWMRAGSTVMIGTLGSLLTFSAFAGISGAVIGSGVVAVESSIKTIQHLDGGLVAELDVKNGDAVRKGDRLLRLDDTALRANLGIVMSRLNELTIQRARLDAEYKGAAAIDVPAELTAAAQSEPRVAAFLASQQTLFSARREKQSGETKLLQEQRTQLADQIDGLTANHDAAVRQVNLIKQEITSVRPLLKQGLYTMSRMLALEREAARLDGDVGRLKGDIARVKGAMSEVDVKIAQLNRDAQQQIANDLREAQARIAELEEQRVAYEDKLRRVEIRAPRTGFVHNLAIHTVGGVVQPASPIMEIIPEEDRLIVEARILPNDIEQVHIGQEATVRFPAFNQRTTPVLKGQVINRSAATLVDRATNIPYFQVDVAVPGPELAKLGEGKSLLPGMQGEVYMKTSERTVLSYLVKPFTDQFQRALRER